MHKFMKYAFLVGMAWSSASCSGLFDKDGCRKIECQNGGTCTGGACECPVEYEGDRCQTPTRDKMLGTYNVVYKVLQPAYREYQGTMEVIADPNNVRQMHIIARANGHPTDTIKIGWMNKTQFAVVSLDSLHGYSAGRDVNYDFGTFSTPAGTPSFSWHFCVDLEVVAYLQ